MALLAPFWARLGVIMFLCALRLPSCAPRARTSRASRNQNGTGSYYMHMIMKRACRPAAAEKTDAGYLRGLSEKPQYTSVHATHALRFVGTTSLRKSSVPRASTRRMSSSERT